MNRVAANVERALAKRPTERAHLAAVAGIGERDLRRRMAGTVRFSLTEVEDIARELGVDPGVLAFGTVK